MTAENENSNHNEEILRLAWEPQGNNGFIHITGGPLGDKTVKVWYVELYMRSGSHGDYPGGVTGHTTSLKAADPNGRFLELRCELDDGVVVDHRITAGRDVIEFRLVASNPASSSSDVAWGAPCIIVDKFTGCDKHSYLTKCFIFLDGKLTRLPVEPWAVEAIETPGQVWCPEHVDPHDVEPHPLSELVPSCGLIGCYCDDEETILAAAWQPYQDLFQGIVCCLHADFRIAGLQPNESRQIEGRIYITDPDIPSLLNRYENDLGPTNS
jgi:hypothetical protein